MQKDLQVNIVFFITAIVAAYKSCVIDVHVPRLLLSQTICLFYYSRSFKMPYKLQLMHEKHHFSL